MAITIGRTWKLFAHRYERDGKVTYQHVGEQWWVEIHHIDRPVVAILVEEIIGDPFEPSVTHYGWEALSRPRPGDEDDPRNPLTVQLRASSDPSDPSRALMLLNVCFPAGIETEIQNGAGKLLALRITERPAE